MQATGPVASDPQIVVLEKDYIFPSVELIYDLLGYLKLPPETTKERFESLLALITDEKNISQSSRTLVYGNEDTDLKNNIGAILSQVKTEIRGGIYQALYILLHQYYLNKSPDDPADARKNAEIAEKSVTHHYTRDELFEGTVILFGTITKRLSNLGPDLSMDLLQKLVVNSINNSKEIVLNPPPKEIAKVVVLKAPRTFLPKFDSDEHRREAQIARDEAFVEDLIRKEQEEADRLFALELQNGSNNEEEEFEEDAAERGPGPGLDQDEDEQPDQDDDEELEDDHSSRHSAAARTRPRY